MKAAFIILASILMLIPDKISYGQWNKVSVNKYGINDSTIFYPYTISSIGIKSRKTSYAVVSENDGALFRTTNEGINWDSVALSCNCRGGNYIYFSDSLTGYIAGYDYILRTNDGGDTWLDISPDSTLAFWNYHYIAEDKQGNIWISALHASFLYEYFPDSNSYKKVYSTGLQTIEKIQFTSPERGYLMGSTDGNWWEPNLYTSIDSGKHWNKVIWKNAVFAGFWDIEFLDDSTAIATNGNNVYKTTNYGVNWTKMLANDPFHLIPPVKYYMNRQLYSIHFINQDTGYIWGLSQIYRTTDGGSSWIKTQLDKDNGQNPDITRVVCETGDHCYAGTGTGKIYYTFNGGGISNAIDEIALDKQILSVTPNPSTGFFTLHLPVTKGVATLKVYDLSGRVLWQREYANQVSSTVSLDLSGTPAGLYLIEWQTADQSYFGKLMIE